MDEEGLRERKRRRTRESIAAAAMRLFTERGFDQVSVDDVAAAADVSTKTVYTTSRPKPTCSLTGLPQFVGIFGVS